MEATGPAPRCTQEVAARALYVYPVDLLPVSSPLFSPQTTGRGPFWPGALHLRLKGAPKPALGPGLAELRANQAKLTFHFASPRSEGPSTPPACRRPGGRGLGVPADKADSDHRACARRMHLAHASNPPARSPGYQRQLGDRPGVRTPSDAYGARRASGRGRRGRRDVCRWCRPLAPEAAASGRGCA